MKRLLFAAAAALSLLTIALHSDADDAVNSPANLELKLVGKWTGQGPCTGGYIFRQDGSYEQTHHGPGDNHSTGTWGMLWQAIPPTLVLHCKTSDDADYLGKHEQLLVELNDESLAMKHPSSTTAAHFLRNK